MEKSLTAPNRYIQGYGIMEGFGTYISHLGLKPFVVGGKTAISTTHEIVTKSVAEHGMACDFAEFSGNGTRADATDLASKATDFGADIIVGIGGGLVIDTAKAVAHEVDLPLVIVPTIASTDAPCSREALQYTDDHQLDRVIIPQLPPPVKPVQRVPATICLALPPGWPGGQAHRRPARSTDPPRSWPTGGS